MEGLSPSSMPSPPLFLVAVDDENWFYNYDTSKWEQHASPSFHNIFVVLIFSVLKLLNLLSLSLSSSLIRRWIRIIFVLDIASAHHTRLINAKGNLFHIFFLAAPLSHRVCLSVGSIMLRTQLKFDLTPVRQPTMNRVAPHTSVKINTTTTEWNEWKQQKKKRKQRAADLIQIACHRNVVVLSLTRWILYIWICTTATTCVLF